MKNERGSAILVVLTLTLLVATPVVVNSFELSRLRRELKRIDQQRQRKYAPAPGKN